MTARSAFAVPFWSVVALFLVCCGGEAAPKSPATGGHDPGATGGAANAGAASGGSATEGGSGARSGSAGCVGTSALCVNGCVHAPETIEVRTCQGGVWQCPAGFTLRSECPSDSCTRSTRSCCDPATGAIKLAECAQEKWLPCPETTGELGPRYDCIPSRANVSSCSQLSGACDSSELRCTSGGMADCGTLCACEADPSGALHWACRFVPCP